MLGYMRVEKETEVRVSCKCRSQVLLPVHIVAIPPVKSVQAPPLPSFDSPVWKPASRTLVETPLAECRVYWSTTHSCAKSDCDGNRSLDSTRYWYDCESPVRILPKIGMNWKEYCRYTLLYPVSGCAYSAQIES